MKLIIIFYMLISLNMTLCSHSSHTNISTITLCRMTQTSAVSKEGRQAEHLKGSM
jgi:hypothetical protein